MIKWQKQFYGEKIKGAILLLWLAMILLNNMKNFVIRKEKNNVIMFLILLVFVAVRAFLNVIIFSLIVMVFV